MEWFIASELANAGLPGMPTTARGMLKSLQKLADGNPDKSRQREGSKATEYHISILPPTVQAALLRKSGKVKVGGMTLDLPKPKAPRYCKEQLWANWSKANDKAHDKAKERVKAVQAVHALVASGSTLMQAYEHISAEFDIALPTLRRYCAAVKGFDDSDWLAVLVPKQQQAALENRTGKLAKVSDQAWEFFKADYLRNERPNAASCYERLKLAARDQSWVVPSINSLMRRMDLEVPHIQQVMLRDGEHAMMQLYPPQERTIEGLDAMSWINGDGYLHNVFVKWFNGEILRPKTWFWQDIYSRKIIGWRTDISENTDSIRLSLMDVCSKYGIPREITIDNTRAAANKWMTGGVANRYRFKVKEDDPLGMIPMLGIKLHWSSVLLGKGHGQAKPIERAFGNGGLEEYIDKTPELEGAYTGSNPMDKPDNYGERVANAEEFLRMVAEGVAMFNAKTGRNTEACRGVMSFDQAFEQSYSQAAVRKATSEQLTMMMLQSEACRVSKHGTIKLESGGTIRNRSNRYYHEALAEYQGQKVVARFDPQRLHEAVIVTTLNGLHICEAACLEKVAFGDTQQAREHKRARTNFVKHNKAAALAKRSMSTMEAAALLPSISDEEAPEAKVVEMVRPVSIGNAAVAIQPMAQPVATPRSEATTAIDFEARFQQAAAAMAAKQKNRI
ncbi:Mu transposase C-terminal domain-containing protein [Aeromonas allosaccharophila]|uniref:transposase domain-containing protein n=1 Tax=Aeromonas allosaccharophila TaxID=656 RepID=UPI001F330860|nr:transposase domain-containing protein [Aeromonas allosaccharophila]MCE9848362.1 Mu transposase C-terminal domain-containing protein [Aeromonas allosaccharophila]